MLGLEYGDLLGWALIAAAGVYTLTQARLPLGAAVAAAALAGIMTKTVLLELV
ncbi:hypothetical protein ACI6QG_02650 [Roseococcus sp. DSY-14]|uniref:hypothetical protein n=1 Tax=Roseococcus sp. DSY-14 TaxID=3369650 RepID=UPI00387AD104